MVTQPVVGVTTYLEDASWGSWNTRAALIHEWYVEALQAVDLDAVLIHPNVRSAEVIDRFDGLVLCGGPDVDARLYGRSPHTLADRPRESRDASELALYRRAKSLGKPILGICRGAQVMAIAEGGWLHQHLPEIAQGVHRTAPGTFVEHDVTFPQDSRLARIYGSAQIVVNSSHHQAIAETGELRVLATAPDGIIEAVELPGDGFVIGVQWHPEHPDRRALDAPLFAEFRDAVDAYSGVT